MHEKSPKEIFDFRSERFIAQRLLGAGNFGTVYEAYDVHHGATVAVKVLKHADAKSLQRFKREFRSLVDLSHPNLVTLYELVCEKGLWCFSMELIKGQDFLSHVRRRASIQFENLVDALLQIARGLSALHRASKVHQDIKPSNLLVGSDGRVVILDFGLVTDLRAPVPGKSSELIGTPNFMSPEQILGQPLTPASDWYSVGAVLYEALTGQPVFDGTLYQVLAAKVERQPIPPSELASQVPPVLEKLCLALLQREPAQRPTASEVIDLLLGDCAAPPKATLPGDLEDTRDCPFVGRDGHIAALKDAFDAVRRGQPVTVLVRGLSGMGKSTLLQQFALSLDGCILVLKSQCYEYEAVPFKAIDGLVDKLASHLEPLLRGGNSGPLAQAVLSLGHLFPVLRGIRGVRRASLVNRSDAQRQREAGFSALRTVFERVVAQGPTVILIDDMQWSDLDSVALLEELWRRPSPPPILIVLAYRSDEEATSPALKALHATLRSSFATEIDVRTVDVAELPSDAELALARTLLGASAEYAQQVVREGHGSPLFITEMVHYIGRHVQSDGISWKTDELSLSIEEVVLERVRNLPSAAQRLLEVVAVAGHPLPRAVARDTAELHGMIGAEPQALALLRSSRLLRIRSQAHDLMLEPYHDRIRYTITTSLEASAKKALHGHLATALMRSGRASAEQMGYHFDEAGCPDQAIPYLITAAEQATAALAFDRAANLYQRVLALRGDDAAMRLKLAAALGNAHRGIDAALQYLRVAAGSTSEQKRHCQLHAAVHYLSCGHFDEGVALVRQVLGDLGLAYPSTYRQALALLLWRRLVLRMMGLNFTARPAKETSTVEQARMEACHLAGVALTQLDVIRGAEFYAHHLLLALRSGDVRHMALGLAREAAQIGAAGIDGWKGSQDMLRRAREMARGIEDPYLAWILVASDAAASLSSGHWQRARRLFEQNEAQYRERYTLATPDHNFGCFMLSLSHLFLGNFGELRRLVLGYLKDAESRSDLCLDTMIRSRFLPELCIVEDDPKAGLQQITQSMQRWTYAGYHTVHYCALLTAAACELYQGNGHAASQRLIGEMPALRASFILRVQLARVLVTDLDARSALLCAAENPSQRTAAIRRAEQAVRELRLQRVTYALGMAHVVDSSLATLRGNPEKALHHAEQAAEHFSQCEMTCHLAALRHRIGQLQGGSAGQTLVTQALADLRARTVRNPEHYIRMLTACV